MVKVLKLDGCLSKYEPYIWVFFLTDTEGETYHFSTKNNSLAFFFAAIPDEQGRISDVGSSFQKWKHTQEINSRCARLIFV